jgi:sugar phosphate isomerase/epimerase
MNRRDFLAAAGGAALAGTADAKAGRIYVAFNSTLTGGRPPWPEIARLAARTGFGGTEVNLNAAMKDGAEATKALLAETRLQPAAAGLPVPITRDEAAFQAGLKALEEPVAFAAAIGCLRMTSVMPAATQTPKAEMRKMIKDRLTAAAAVLHRHKIRLGLEFLGPLQFRTRQPHEFIWRMDEMLEFGKECGPNVGLLLDAWHWHHAGATVKDILAAGKSRIVHVHISDCPKMPPEQVRDNQRVMPGEGAIDLVGFLKALKKVGYTDGVAPEPLGRIPKEMPPEEGAKLGLDTTMAVMRKAGVA